MLQLSISQSIKEFRKSNESLELSTEQKKELDSRRASFHDNPSIGHTWREIKSNILKRKKG